MGENFQVTMYGESARLHCDGADFPGSGREGSSFRQQSCVADRKELAQSSKRVWSPEKFTHGRHRVTDFSTCEKATRNGSKPSNHPQSLALHLNWDAADSMFFSARRQGALSAPCLLDALFRQSCAKA